MLLPTLSTFLFYFFLHYCLFFLFLALNFLIFFSNLLIFIESSTTDPMTWAVKAGDFSDSGIGDLAITSVTALTQVFVVETARFKDNDELILIDATGTDAAATIFAVELL